MQKIDNQKAKKTTCYGITNNFKNPNLRLFFNEYDNWDYFSVLEEANILSRKYGIDLYILESSKNNFHLLSFDILNLQEVKQIINSCTNDGDYLYNFFDRNFEYVLRLSEKEKKKIPKLLTQIFSLRNEHKASLQHYKAYKIFTGYEFPIPTTKVFEDLETKIVIYQTNRRKENEKN